MTGCPSLFSLFKSSPVTKEHVIDVIKKKYANYFMQDKTLDLNAIDCVANNYLQRIAFTNQRVSNLSQFCSLSPNKIHTDYLLAEITAYRCLAQTDSSSVIFRV